MKNFKLFELCFQPENVDVQEELSISMDLREKLKFTVPSCVKKECLIQG